MRFIFKIDASTRFKVDVGDYYLLTVDGPIYDVENSWGKCFGVVSFAPQV